MGNTLKLNHHATSGKTPTNLAAGEVAINSANKKIWVGTNGTTAGQVLVFDHSIYSTDLTDNNDNYYLTGITKNTNTLTFAVSGTSNVTYEFGANAFTSTTIPTNTNQLTNGAGFVTNSGVTGISTSAGLDGSGTSGTVTVSLDLSELTDMTADVVGSSDELILLDSGSERRKAINEIKLSQFNNDAGFTTAGGHNHDSRYYTESEVDSLLSGKSSTGHNHNSTYLALTGGTLNSGGNDTTLAIQCKNAGRAMLQLGDSTDGSQGTGVLELTQDGSYGAGLSYNGDNNPTFATGESSDNMTFYRLNNGSRDEVFSYPYNSNTVTFNGALVWSGGGSANANTAYGWGNHASAGYTTASNSQTFTNKGGNISQWTNDAGYITDGNTGWNNSYGFVTSSGVTSVASGTGITGGTITGTGTLSLALGELTDMTSSWDNSVDEFIVLDNGSQARKRSAEIFGSNAFNSTTIPTNNNQLTNGAGYTTNVGDITNVSVGTGLDGGGSSGDVTVSLDLSELPDMTQSWANGSDEFIVLDSGTQKRKLSSEIFGSNAFNSTTIPTNTNQLTNGAGFTTNTGTTTASNSQTFTNKGGNISMWTNNSGYVTSSGVTSVSVGTGLDGGGSSSSVTVSLDLSELADMTQSWTSSDEFIVLDGGVQKRKQSSEIFGSNAFNSTTIPTNTNQLTNGAGFTTAGGHNHDSRYYTEGEVDTLISSFVTSSGVTSVSVGTGLDGGGSSSSVTVSLDLSELADMTQSWTNGSDEFIVLDGGTQKRKLSSEIFGSNAFNSTTIPTNTNQLTNGANFATLSEIDDSIEAYGGGIAGLTSAGCFGGAASGVTNQGLSRDVAYKIMNNSNSSVACVTTQNGSSGEYLHYASGGNFSWDVIEWNHIQNMSSLNALP